MKNEYKPQELGGLKIFCICVGMIMLGGGLALGIVVIGLTPQFLTDQDCYALVENATNQSMMDGINIGKIIVARVVSDMFIQYNEIPIYYQINETTIGWQMVNLTEYYLNKIGINNG